MNEIYVAFACSQGRIRILAPVGSAREQIDNAMVAYRWISCVFKRSEEKCEGKFEEKNA